MMAMKAETCSLLN